MMKAEKIDRAGDEKRKTPLGIERRFDRFGEWLDSSWALRKFKPFLQRYPGVTICLTWLMRVIVGATFIISGLSKGIDPWGTFYKMTEYLTAMHFPVESWGNTALVLTFFLFSVEFVVGVSLLTGCFRKASPIIAAIIMLVMLPLSLWIAVADPVADCGCFGDFWVISNWWTFAKNVGLSIAVVWLLMFNGVTFWLISPFLQWIAAVASAVYIMLVGYIGYWEQPLVDFRPYRIGTTLLSADDGPEYEPVFEFVYEKDGETHSFSEDDELPSEEDGWKFVKRIEKEMVKTAPEAGAGSNAGDFRIWNETGDEDVTSFVDSGDKQVILLIPDISQLSMAASWKINRLYDLSRKDDMDFFAVAAGSPEAIEEWRDLSSGQYPIYTAEDTSIKEVARGNPALIGLDEGKIVWKTALSALRIDDDDTGADSLLEIGVKGAGEAVLVDLSEILFSILALLGLVTALRVLIPSFFSGSVDAEKNEEQDSKTP